MELPGASLRQAALTRNRAPSRGVILAAPTCHAHRSASLHRVGSGPERRQGGVLRSAPRSESTSSELDMLDLTRAMDHAYHLDPVILRTIEDEVSSDDPCPSVRRDPRARASEARIVRKQSALGLDPVEQTIGRPRAVLGNIQPDLEKVGFRLRTSGAARHSRSARAVSLLG